MEWIDSHCHLDSFYKKGELQKVLKRAQDNSVTKMIVIGTDCEDWNLNYNLKKEHPKLLDYTIGLHPCRVDQNWERFLEEISIYFKKDFYPVAIGEIGLDYYHLPKQQSEIEEFKNLQHRAFKSQLSIAKEFDCPIIIHSRDAFDDTISMIDNSGFDWNRVVMHCFSYSCEQIKVINKKGGRASFTGIVTYRNAPNIKKSLLEQDLELLMIETDSPYLAPEPYRGKINEPAYVADIGKKCAEYFGMEVDAFSKKITKNTRDFFSLKNRY